MTRTIEEISNGFLRADFTPMDILEDCLVRIDQLDEQIRAWVLVDQDQAREDAKRCKDEMESGNWRGWLHGIPIGVKDIFDVAGWPTALGVPQQTEPAREDSWIVRRLRELGAIILGKTVTTPYACFDPALTRNPWHPDHTPGGSSSGSAAAVACGMCLAAIGSQTGGSITRPASYCGVCGLKPTFGALPHNGTMIVSPHLDHGGVMARSVSDLHTLISEIIVIAPSTMPARLRIGRLGGIFEENAHPDIRAMMNDVCDRLSRSALIESVPLPDSFSELFIYHRRLMSTGAAHGHARRLGESREMCPPLFRSLLEEGLRTSGTEIIESEEHQRNTREECEALFKDYDILLTPATPTPPPDRATTGDPSFNSPWSYTGHPTVSLPARWTDDGLPLAIQCVGPFKGEGKVLAVAQWIEEQIGFEHRSVGSLT